MKLLKNKWLWGCIAGFCALVSLRQSMGAFLDFTALTVFILPPTHEWLMKRLPFHIPSFANWTTAIVLAIIGLGLTPLHTTTSLPIPTSTSTLEVSPSPQSTQSPTEVLLTSPSPTLSFSSPVPTPKQFIQPTASPNSSGLSNNNYYTNTNGDTVHAPANSDTVPIGATARCNDGTYSFSENHRGTCSGHGGVATWNP